MSYLTVSSSTSTLPLYETESFEEQQVRKLIRKIETSQDSQKFYLMEKLVTVSPTLMQSQFAKIQELVNSTLKVRVNSANEISLHAQALRRKALQHSPREMIQKASSWDENLRILGSSKDPDISNLPQLFKDQITEFEQFLSTADACMLLREIRVCKNPRSRPLARLQSIAHIFFIADNYPSAKNYFSKLTIKLIETLESREFRTFTLAIWKNLDYCPSDRHRKAIETMILCPELFSQAESAYAQIEESLRSFQNRLDESSAKLFFEALEQHPWALAHFSDKMRNLFPKWRQKLIESPELRSPGFLRPFYRIQKEVDNQDLDRATELYFLSEKTRLLSKQNSFTQADELFIESMQESMKTTSKPFLQLQFLLNITELLMAKKAPVYLLKEIYAGLPLQVEIENLNGSSSSSLEVYRNIFSLLLTKHSSPVLHQT